MSNPAPQPRSLRDNWWWSGALWLVGGGVVAYYQWQSISVGEAIWANWLLAAVGIGLAVTGAVRLWRDWGVEQARRADEATPE